MYIDPGSGSLVLQMLAAGLVMGLIRGLRHVRGVFETRTARPGTSGTTGERLHMGFRDPDGFLVRTQGRILRWVSPRSIAWVEALLQGPAFRDLREAGHLIPGQRCPDADLPPDLQAMPTLPGGTWFEHPAFPFPTYPEEWTWTMLRDAARLTLDLQARALDAGFELKDATPRNILFEGTRPVMVDALSLEPRPEGSPIWRAEAQFVKTFLLPLALHSDRGLNLARAFMGFREGISFEEALPMVGSLRRWTRPYLRWVTLPVLFSHSRLAFQEPLVSEDKAIRLQRKRIQSLRKAVDRIKPPKGMGVMADYAHHCTYSLEAISEKHTMVEEALQLLTGPGRVLDLGANAGEYSVMAAARSHEVVAVEANATALDRLVQEHPDLPGKVLPVVANLAYPTPAAGWRGVEQASLDERMAKGFDLVLALALTHHIRFTEGVPFDIQADALARWTREWALVEWVDRSDPMAEDFARRFGFWPHDYTPEAFESALNPHFDIVQRRTVSTGERTLYLLRLR